MSARSSFALVAALLLVVAQCAEVKSIQNQFKFLLNKAMVDKANAGYKPSVLNIPGSELLADSAYSSTGFLTLSSSYESSCSRSFKSHAVAVGSCITENSISYKFQLVKDSCAGAVVQYFYDDACSLYAGSSEFEESAMTCSVKGAVNTRPEYTSLTCSTAAAEAHTAVLAEAAPSMEPTAQPTTKPTQKNTAYPTAAAPITVSFVAQQTISGISLDSYNSDPELYGNTLKESIAQTMDGVSADDIYDLTVTSSDSSRESASLRTFAPRLLATSAIQVTYRVEVETLLTATDLENQLVAAVNSGDFDSILQSTATANGATDLETATSDSVVIEPGDDSDDDLSGGAIAGIVIGVVFGVVLIALAVYYFAFAGGSLSNMSSGEAHVEL